MAFSLYGGLILSLSLNNGMRSLEARLGADIAVVPLGSEADYENIILVGSPVNFYIDRSVEQQIAAVAGVRQFTTHFYLATLANAFCCTTSIQIIGIDYDTDFVVKPWITKFLRRQIGDREVIVGSDVIIERDNTVKFFDTVFNVAARLKRTATGMDNTVFLNMAAARGLAGIAQAGGQILNDVDVYNAVSAVLVRVDPNFYTTSVVYGIQKSVPDVGIVTGNRIYSSISVSLNFFMGMIRTISTTFGIFAALILTLSFSVIAFGRKKEFAVLRILGATRKKLAGIVLTEALAISLCGAIIGSLLAIIVVFPFGRYIGQQIGMPLLLPPILDSLKLLVVGLGISVAVGSLSSAYSAFKASRAEIYTTMREGE